MTTPSISDLSALREVAEKHPGAEYLAELEMSAKMVTHWVGLYAYEAFAIVEYVAAEKARADAAEAERNTFKAKDASKSKLLERFRDLLLNMCDHFEDEGDRVYFGSTNDPDELREIAQQMDDWKWDAIMGQTKSDPYADLRELRATISTLTAERDALIRERDEAREARVTLAMIDRLVEAELDSALSCANGGAPSSGRQQELARELDDARRAVRSALSGAKDEREGNT